MGASTSNLTAEEVHRLSNGTHFSPKEIETLYERYTQLDRTKSGLVSLEELRLIPELSMNPLMPRILSLFASDGEDHINFQRFVNTLSAFHPKAPVDEKCLLAFRVYDVDEDGAISEDDLFAVMKLLVGDNLSPGALRIVVQKTFREALSESGESKKSQQQQQKQQQEQKATEESHSEPVKGLNIQQFGRVIGDLSNFQVTIS